MMHAETKCGFTSDLGAFVMDLEHCERGAAVDTTGVHERAKWMKMVGVEHPYRKGVKRLGGLLDLHSPM
jgi:hypothetical protein